jgi:hypothetical protein
MQIFDQTREIVSQNASTSILVALLIAYYLLPFVVSSISLVLDVCIIIVLVYIAQKMTELVRDYTINEEEEIEEAGSNKLDKGELNENININPIAKMKRKRKITLKKISN